MDEHFHGAGGTPYSTYAPSPMYTTVDNTAAYLKNTEYASYSNSSYTVWSDTVEGGYIIGSSYYELIEQVTAVTGRFSPVPSWTSSGAVVGMQGGSDAVKAKLAVLKEGGVPVAGLWLQDWAGKRVDSFGSRVLWNWEVSGKRDIYFFISLPTSPKFFQLDTEFYPDWPDMLESWALEGIYVLAYINPCLSTRVGEFKPHARRDLFLEAEARGFLVNTTDGGAYVQSSASDEFQFGTVDLTLKEAREWYQAVVVRCNLLCECKEANKMYPPMKPYDGELVCGLGGEGHGVKGWMADFGEVRKFRSLGGVGGDGGQSLVSVLCAPSP